MLSTISGTSLSSESLAHPIEGPRLPEAFEEVFGTEALPDPNSTSRRMVAGTSMDRMSVYLREFPSGRPQG